MTFNIAALYVRLSKEDLDSGERESVSIQNQKSMLFNYAMEKEWQVFKVYCDEDYSGAYAGDDNDRPEFNKMLKDAKDGKFNIIVCKSQSRFSRNMEVVEKYINGIFNEWGIRFIGLTDNADTEVKGNKKSRQITGLVNEWYIEDLSDNIRAVFRHKMNKGDFLAAFPPYGYVKDPLNKNHLIPHPTTAAIVKQMFYWHKEGYGAAKICQMLNDRGIPNPRKQQEIDGYRKTKMYDDDDNGIWATTTVLDMLHKQVYCGDIVQHQVEKVSYKSKKVKKLSKDQWIVVKDMHEPLVSREDFEATQRRLNSRRRASGTGMVHILSGVVYCYHCGKPMHKIHCKGRNEYLRCSRRYDFTNKICPTPNIPTKKVFAAMEMELIEKFKGVAIDKLDKKYVDKLLEKNSGNDNFLEAELKHLTDEKAKIEHQQKNLYSDRLNDIITLDQYISYNSSFVEKLAQLNRRIEDLDVSMQDKRSDRAKSDDTRKAILSFLETNNINRDIIDNLVERIEFGEINPTTGKPILDIIWKWG